ncbi:MAG: hypothetical protein OEU54_11745 [Gemmatimonadota bacterium]|nr:hypothetical protein [Gemmatimonadota bacterium]
MHSGEVQTVSRTSGEGGYIVPDRWTLIRDAAVFQLKLAVDGLRDFVMMPIALGVTVLDLLNVGPRAGRQFYDLLRVGRRTENWINLFGATEHAETLPATSRPGIDTLVRKMESLVVQEYERGGITASAKESVDRLLDGINDRPGSV